MNKPIKIKPRRGEYALYKGEELVMMGTIEEIAKHQGVKESTIHFYHSPTYKKEQKTDMCLKGLMKMNKYQEALDNLCKACKCNTYNEVHCECKEKLLLQELVDKATPKKPAYESDGYYDGELVYDTWICPNCKKRYELDYDKYDYCPCCGQKLDWSDDDEQTN